MPRLALTTMATLAALAATAPRAEDAHRELGAHVHGIGALNIAVQGAEVAMELHVPGSDIVGFEHEAETAEDKAALAEETPVGRLGTAAEVAKLLVFLAGEDAGYITGQVFGVNGGLVI